MVPGDHDVSRDRTVEPVAKALHHLARTKPAHLDDVLRKGRDAKKLGEKLAHYTKFARDVSKSAKQAPWGVDWHDTVMVPNAGTIRLIGLCTVWTSDALDGRLHENDFESFHPNLVVGQGQVQSLLEYSSDEDLFLLLTHHPLEWLHPWSQQHVRNAFGNRVVVHLCGHLHVPHAQNGRRFGTDGQMIRSVAGAAHDNPQGVGQHGYSWGELRHGDNGWEVGWAPRVFDPGANAMARSALANLDDRGFAWERFTLDGEDRVQRATRASDRDE